MIHHTNTSLNKIIKLFPNDTVANCKDPNTSPSIILYRMLRFEFCFSPNSSHSLYAVNINTLVIFCFILNWTGVYWLGMTDIKKQQKKKTSESYNVLFYIKWLKVEVSFVISYLQFLCNSISFMELCFFFIFVIVLMFSPFYCKWFRLFERSISDIFLK